MAERSIRLKLFVIEGLGVALALFGAFVLIGVLFPIINPGQFQAEHGAGASMPLAFYLTGSFFAVGFMSIGYALTRRARRIRAAAVPSPPPPTLNKAEKPGKSIPRTIRRLEAISFALALIGATVVLGPLFFYNLGFLLIESHGLSLDCHGLLGLLLSLAALGFTESATALRKRQPENSPLRRAWWKSGYKLILALLILFALIA